MTLPLVPERRDPAYDLDERSMLTEFLDMHRTTVHRKVAGLSDDDAWRRFVPSLTSAAGILKHLGYVEQSWFRVRLAGETGLPVPWTDENPDADFERADGDTLDGLLDVYDRQCERSREVAASMQLDDLAAAPGRDGQHTTLRWVLVHMIEETARHNGHLDLIRELTDGQTGE
ncbi:MAG: DinB family protein [Acidimicrobiales bacterium]